MDLRDDMSAMLAAAGVDDIDVDNAVEDEHVRYDVYLRVLRAARPPNDRVVIARVLRDPDDVMAEAAVARHAERVARDLTSYPAYRRWADSVLPLVDGWSFLTSRIEEWGLYRAIADGDLAAVPRVRDASDWLQRKLVEGAPGSHVLRVLAEQGRTRRVRNMARARLH